MLRFMAKHLRVKRLFQGKVKIWVLLSRFLLEMEICSILNTGQIILLLSLLSSTIYIFAFLADALFSSSIKMKMLYFWGHLPGETIFSTLEKNNTDLRFSTEHLLEKYKKIYDGMPTDKQKKYRYENDHWYRIYNRYRDIPMIFVSNRDYLLCRDLYISTIIIVICYVISCSILSVFYWNIESVVYLICMLLVTNISAHIKGRRFAMNVVAYDLHTDNTK